MKYYEYRPDANTFDAVRLDYEKDHERVVHIFYSDARAAPEWSPVTTFGFGDNRGIEADIPSLNDYGQFPLMTERAWNALRPLIGYCCEALPIIHPNGKPHYLVHVMETIDCLDESRSELKRFTDGGIMRVRRYAFMPGVLEGKHIFKLPLESGSGLYVDDEFRNVVEANNLKGLIFKELPMTE
jgi:uncharacterized protein DUF1629